LPEKPARSAGAIPPVIYGFLGDRIGINGAAIGTALTALAILPLAMVLRPHLARQD
jgi:Na+-driven multidrug efflux pump